MNEQRITLVDLMNAAKIFFLTNARMFCSQYLYASMNVIRKNREGKFIFALEILEGRLSIDV